MECSNAENAVLNRQGRINREGSGHCVDMLAGGKVRGGTRRGCCDFKSKQGISDAFAELLLSFRGHLIPWKRSNRERPN